MRSDREKLIELLREANAETAAKIEKGEIEDAKIGWEFFADHLLANGVVVREKGEWYRFSDEYEICATEFTCPVCKESFGSSEMTDEEFVEMMKFCPNCGADMRKGENG